MESWSEGPRPQGSGVPASSSACSPAPVALCAACLPPAPAHSHSTPTSRAGPWSPPEPSTAHTGPVLCVPSQHGAMRGSAAAPTIPLLQPFGQPRFGRGPWRAVCWGSSLSLMGRGHVGAPRPCLCPRMDPDLLWVCQARAPVLHPPLLSQAARMEGWASGYSCSSGAGPPAPREPAEAFRALNQIAAAGVPVGRDPSLAQRQGHKFGVGTARCVFRRPLGGPHPPYLLPFPAE